MAEYYEAIWLALGISIIGQTLDFSVAVHNATTDTDTLVAMPSFSVILSVIETIRRTQSDSYLRHSVVRVFMCHSLVFPPSSYFDHTNMKGS